MRLSLALLMIVMFAAACAGGGEATEESALPTLAELPSETPTDAPTATHTEPPATDTPEPSDTPTPSDTPEPPTTTPTYTPTEPPTATPSRTPDATRAFVGTSTAAVEEAPRYATFTPAPPNATARPTSTGTPQVVAEVVITEPQFQEEVDLAIEGMGNVQSAQVDFSAEGITFELTVVGESGAFTTGDVLITVSTTGGIARFQGRLLVPEGAPEPPESFIEFATGDFFLQMVEVLDRILNQRLGEGHDLETLQITDDAIQLSLLANAPG